MATRLSTRFNLRTDVFSAVTPPPWVQDNIVAPQGAWKPAAWLPVVFTKSDVSQGEDAFTISSGKVVALDSEGRIVPAGYRGIFAATTATVVLTYTADDYKYGVIDITTGERYATNGTTTYTSLAVAKALVERGLVPEDTVSNNPPSSNADCEAIAKAFISRPVGVANYDVYVWSGLPETGDQFLANYSKQHAVQFKTEAQMKAPWRVGSSTTSDVFDVSAITVTSAVSGAGDFPQPGEVWDIDALVDLARYDLDGTEAIVALALAYKPVAKNTTRTPFECDVATLLLKEKTSVAGVTKVGDWFLDESVGLLFVHADSYDALVTANTDPTFSYYYYDDAGIGVSTDQFIFLDGEAKPGDLLSVDKHSNFVVKGVSADILASTDPSIGRFLYHYTEPRQLLDQVKSAYNLVGAEAKDKMPGTATGGYSDTITLAYAAGEDVSNRVAVLTVRF